MCILYTCLYYTHVGSLSNVHISVLDCIDYEMIKLQNRNDITVMTSVFISLSVGILMLTTT